ncbi:MAG: hypothetical protein ACI4NB_08890 [Candidatus Ornithospirochaeta sp.]
MQQEEKERFEVDIEKGILTLNGASDGTVSNKMFEDGIRKFIEDAHEKGIEKPVIESIVISSKVRVLLADVFSNIGKHEDVDLSSFTIISESGDWEITPNRGLHSPFVGMETSPKAFIFNSKIPKGMEVLRDGTYKEEGILEGVGQSLVFGVNVDRIPERAFSNSSVSYFNINASDDLLRIGKEAFFVSDKKADVNSDISINNDKGNYLTEEESKRIAEDLKNLIESQEERFKEKIKNLTEEMNVVISDIDNAPDDKKEGLKKELSTIEESIRQATRKQKNYEKIGLEYNYSKFVDLVIEGAERLKDGITTLSLHNVSSDFADRALAGNKNLFISYQNGFKSELQSRLIEERNRIDKVVEETGLTEEEKENLGKFLTNHEELHIEVKNKIGADTLDSLNELVEFNRRVQAAGENGSLLLTTYGCALGKEVIKDSGVTAVINSRGEKSSERLAIERSNIEKKRERLKDIITFKLSDKGKPEIIDDLLEKMKETESQIESSDEKLGNVRLKDRALSGAEYLSAVDIDTDGSAKDLLKGSGKSSGGILFPGEKKVVADKQIEAEKWKADPFEMMSSYIESWRSVRKMSLIDQFFDIVKNLLLLSSTGLVLGIKKRIEKEEPEVVFEIEPKLFIRDEILKREVTFTSSEDWEEYIKIRDKYREENSRIKEIYESKEYDEIELAIRKRDLNKEYREAVKHLFFSDKSKEKFRDNPILFDDDMSCSEETKSVDSDSSNTVEEDNRTAKVTIRKGNNGECIVELDGVYKEGEKQFYHLSDIKNRLSDLEVFRIILKGYLSNISGENLYSDSKEKRLNSMLSLIEENYGKEEKEAFRSLLKDEEAIKEKLTQYMGKTEDVYNIGKSFVETMKDANETTVAFYNKDSLNLFFAPTLPSLLDKNKEKEVLSKGNDALDMSKYENTYSLSHSEKVHTR